MNKHLFGFVLRNPDANTESASSADSAATATESQSDANQNTQESSTSGDAKQESLSDVINRIKEKHSVKSDSSTEDGEVKENVQADEEASKSSVQKENKTNEEAPTESKDKKGEQKADSTTPDDSKLPFHKHPRFQELTKQRAEYETKVKELEPVAQRMQAVEKFCQENGVTAQDYDEAIRFAALIKQNPQEAEKKLESILSTLRVSNGSVLPQDLQKEVDDGRMAEAHAKTLAASRIENAKLKAQSQAQQLTAQQRVQQELTTSLDSWTANKAKLDPSYKPKTNGAPDGKFEFVADRFMRLWQEKPPQTVAAAVALADEAYNQVNGFVSSITPKPTVRRPMQASQARQTNDKPVDTSKPGWAREVARRRLAETAD